MSRRVLVVDDDARTRALLADILASLRVIVDQAGTVADARRLAGRHGYNLFLVDQRLPDGCGLDFVRELEIGQTRRVAVLITGYADIRDAISAIREGLFDYLEKPFESLDALEAVITRALAFDAALREADALRELVGADGDHETMVGQSPAIRQLLERIASVAPLDTTVLIEGESGTGKELAARLVHRASGRAAGPFVAVNCGALTEELLESALFGYERGAFTGAERTTPGFFEAAHGGTLFLDEIADMSPKLQSALLRVVEERGFSRLGGRTLLSSDFRLVCATNRALRKLVAEGRFREDLYWRLAVVVLTTPPLRERRSDIIGLATHFLDRLNARFGRNAGPFTPEALEALETAEWRGNVRELRHTIERVVALQPLGPITAGDLFGAPSGLGPPRGTPERLPLDYATARERFEREWLDQLLEVARGNVSTAARLSGLARQNLYSRIRRYRCSVPSKL